MSAGELSPGLRQIRECAQEAISACGFDSTGDLARSLVSEYSEEYGVDFALVLFDFIAFHYAGRVHPQVAVEESGRFLFTLGDLIELYAIELQCDVNDVLIPLLCGDLLESEGVEADLVEQIRRTVRAAQTTLAAHFWVRRGNAPLGVQQHLNLEDLCAVARGLSVLGAMLVQVVEGIGLPAPVIAGSLLPHVRAILERLASDRDESLETVISGYWMALSGPFLEG